MTKINSDAFVSFGATDPGDEMTPYERLLGGALRGDASLFAREDGVEAAWYVVDPILRYVTPVFEYEQRTWGPAQSDRLIEDNGGWHRPMAPRQRGDFT